MPGNLYFGNQYIIRRQNRIRHPPLLERTWVPTQFRHLSKWVDPYIRADITRGAATVHDLADHPFDASDRVRERFRTTASDAGGDGRCTAGHDVSCWAAHICAWPRGSHMTPLTHVLVPLSSTYYPEHSHIIAATEWCSPYLGFGVHCATVIRVSPLTPSARART